MDKYLNIMLTGLHCFHREDNYFLLIFKLKKKQKTVEISLYINKFNFYVFFLKKNRYL